MATKTIQSTNLLKKYISEKYGMKTKIKSNFYSGGSSLNISYNLGLATSLLKTEFNRLQYGTFDAMIDLAGYKNTAEVGMTLNNVEIETYKHVFIDREISDNFKLIVCQEFFKRFNFGIELPQIVNDIFKSSEENLNKIGAWSLANYIHKHLVKMNFVTNNENEITNFHFKENANINDYEGIEAFYTYNNIEYSTKEIKIKETLRTIEKLPTIVLNDVKMIDYSDKAIAVIGNTFEIKESLKELGGKFNKFLNIDGEKKPGWIFGKNKKDDISNLLIEYSEK